MTYQKIASVLKAPSIMMGHIPLKQAIPMQGLQQFSPFILLHHFDFEMKPGENSFNVPAHPHRGFCPITYMFEGSVQHNDSLGNSKIISDNEVQWITAARGIIHSEIAAPNFVETGGRFHGIQLWINLPSEDKMKVPSYQAITSNEINVIEKEGIEFRLVSGKMNEQIGPAHSNVITAMLRMKAGSEYSLHLPSQNNSAIYILEGELLLNNETNCEQYNLVLFSQEDGEIKLYASSDSKLLILSGEPIDEPLVTHGPFVMNTQTEILEAMRDYQEGKMGFLY
jgi:quercetin 2,3-dioxygenase